MVVHVYNRGVNRSKLFFTLWNYDFFVTRMERFLPPSGIAILAYCLMPNHYHLLLQVHEDRLSKAMQRMTMSYATSLNNVYRRTGPVFTGRYRTVPVVSDGQLVHVSGYIHRNPVVGGMVEDPEDWPYSSFREYLGVRKTRWVSTDTILGLFAQGGAPSAAAARTAYRDFVLDTPPPAKD
jgi:REP element-mobilizing transposase RayT